jgi:hypothetical protein
MSRNGIAALMEEPMRQLLVLLCISCLGVSCAADQAARQLANRTASTLVSYEGEVQRKVDAENAFYRQQLRQLREALIGYTELSQVAKGAAAGPTSGSGSTTVLDKEEESVKRSLLFGRIVVTAQRDARLFAEEIINSPAPGVMSQIISIASRGVE